MLKGKMQVRKIGPSIDGKDKVSFWVTISEDYGFEVRIPTGTLETLSEPEERIKEWFATGPLPKADSVIDIDFNVKILLSPASTSQKSQR